MAETPKTTTVNTAVKGGDHDRVAMLSLRADGTPDQIAPEFIGDQDVALAATAEQFRQQAVSAADVRERGITAAGVEASTVEDPTIADLKTAHEAAEKKAESDAKAAVAAFHAKG